jgi:membrane-bound lytic murein transglycosylase D
MRRLAVLVAVALATIASGAAGAGRQDAVVPAAATHAVEATPVATVAPPAPAAPAEVEPALVPATRSGAEIYRRFHDGLADPDCAAESSSPRWRRHFAGAPSRFAKGGDDSLALFGYVVDALRDASLPTEYALIPFVESGYKPDARSPLGPAGMWQMIRVTARSHQVPMRPGYDGRLSPVDSTRAAVRYLKTLHGMFAGDWRLAVMAYNAGEYRVFGALRRSGQVARNADPEKLTSLSGITRAYVRKLHALSCLFDHADEGEQWLHALDRQVPLLEAVVLPPDVHDLSAWARANGRDAVRVKRLNPAFAGGRVARADRGQRALVQAFAPALLAGGTGAGDAAVGSE